MAGTEVSKLMSSLFAAARHALFGPRPGAAGALGDCDPAEIERMARELGMSRAELERLAARGPEAADLLHERLAALGLTLADARRLAPGLVHDLVRTCSCCEAKTECAQDLAERPSDPRWRQYCPNGNTLEAVRQAKGRFPA